MSADVVRYRVPMLARDCELGQELDGFVRVSRKDLWDEDLASLPGPVESGPIASDWYWAQFDWRNKLVLVPSNDWYHRVLTSRNYPVVSVGEQQLLRGTTVVIAGLSVGRSVATQLARFGVERFVLVDGDCLAPANLNRLHGSSICDMGLSKVEGVAREILEINPWAVVEGLVGRLDGEGLRAILQSRSNAVLVEMIDDVKAKLELRLVARDFDVPVVHAHDFDWTPMVDIELPAGPMFGGRISPSDFDDIADAGEITFERRTALAMQIIAPPTWPPRSLAGGQLARIGRLQFWPQIGPCAAATGALAVRAIFDLVRGAEGIPGRASLSLSGSLGTSDPLDDTDRLMDLLPTSPTEVGAH